VNGEKWPKRRTWGAFLNVCRLSSLFPNLVSILGGKGFKVCLYFVKVPQEILQSNSIEFDKLMDFMEPIDRTIKVYDLIVKERRRFTVRY
jgi:hypothetical protein